MKRNSPALDLIIDTLAVVGGYLAIFLLVYLVLTVLGVV